MSEAEIRFRMPEGVDIGARLPFPTRSRSTAACPFAGHRGVAPGGVRWPELSGAPRRRSEPAWVPIAPASPGRSRAVYRAPTPGPCRRARPPGPVQHLECYDAQTPPDLHLLTTNDPTPPRPPLTPPSSLPSIHPQVRSTSRSTPKYTRSRSSS